MQADSRERTNKEQHRRAFLTIPLHRIIMKTVKGGRKMRLIGITPDWNRKTGKITVNRDYMDAVSRCGAVPVLAICRGLQIMNCALGGTLYQDIGEQETGTLNHVRHDIPREPAHEVRITDGRLLKIVTGAETLHVNSRHHQAIRTLGMGLLPCAVAPDGIIEGVEVPGKRFALGVQWHPESMSEKHPEEQKIFNAFTEACGE